MTVEMVDISAQYEIPQDKLRPIARLKSEHVWLLYVAEAHVGLLFVDGKLVKTYPPGVYGFWKPAKEILFETVDTRLQQSDVSGQEMLTQDRVSLRVNLTCGYAVKDPVKARTSVAKYQDALYKELQFGLREAVSAATLDDLLSHKEKLNAVIVNYATPKLAEIGIEVKSIGVKDVILPGDMRDIMNKVVEAQKLAEANLIKRREETAATRSLLNTAKLMQDNPVLLRLKELEALEKVTENIQTLNIYGGFDGLLNEVINLKTPEKSAKKSSD